jgi:hypothetical protein
VNEIRARFFLGSDPTWNIRNIDVDKTQGIRKEETKLVQPGRKLNHKKKERQH